VRAWALKEAFRDFWTWHDERDDRTPSAQRADLLHASVTNAGQRGHQRRRTKEGLTRLEHQHVEALTAGGKHDSAGIVIVEHARVHMAFTVIVVRRLFGWSPSRRSKTRSPALPNSIITKAAAFLL
jgi:hypothetical protein